MNSLDQRDTPNSDGSPGSSSDFSRARTPGTDDADASRALTPPSDACPKCGAARETQWAFCGSCGGPLPNSDRNGTTFALDKVRPGTPPTLVAPVTSVPVPDEFAQVPITEAQRSGLRNRKTLKLVGWVTLSGVTVAFATAAVTGWVKWDNSQEQLARTRSSLEETTTTLTFTQDQLDSIMNQLDETHSTLATTEHELTAVRHKLKDARGSLDSAQDRLDLQATQIDSLQTCLGGESDSLRYAASGYFEAALAALRAVEGPCQDTQDIL